MHLTDMTGVQLAQVLHEDPGCSGVGFVLASSESDGGEASKVLDAPLTALLPKPFDLQAAGPIARPGHRTNCRGNPELAREVAP